MNSSGRSLRSSLLPSIHPSLFLSFFISLALLSSSFARVPRPRAEEDRLLPALFFYIFEKVEKERESRTVGGLIRKWRPFDRFEREESNVRRLSNHREVNRATGVAINYEKKKEKRIRPTYRWIIINPFRYSKFTLRTKFHSHFILYQCNLKRDWSKHLNTVFNN